MRCKVVKNLLSIVVLVFPLVAAAAPQFHNKIDVESAGLKSAIPADYSKQVNHMGQRAASLDNGQSLIADEDGAADNAPTTDGPVVQEV